MGGSVSKNGRYNNCEKYAIILKGKVRLLQEEIKEIMCEREKESRSYERDIMVFTFKEADWKQERKRMKEEMRQLRKTVEEREERIREMEEAGIMGVERKESEKEWEIMGRKLLVEQMQDERERRDETVEKWKQLYLAIKNELDDLIQRTYDGLSLLFFTSISLLFYYIPSLSFSLFLFSSTPITCAISLSLSPLSLSLSLLFFTPITCFLSVSFLLYPITHLLSLS